ncbi:DUF6941 family protein [Nocardia sp. alder85J]|uniref:DUF6941 family protein n=1 Tax=Nocardia sp. alder85J TaxID=2862949 RepID=UPI001CD75C46|nr:hypothetical protein [Nocardia sp. alder85J]MCX4098699.1 hypothetical protein [Nocardia sp. alder85J]
MTFSVLLLADHAAVAEGALYVNGGGINLLGKDSFPAPLNAMLAAAIDVPVDRFDTPIQFTVTVSAGDEDPGEIARIDGEFVAGFTPGIDLPPHPASNPFVIDLRPLTIPRAGNYIITARTGEVEQKLYFSVINASAGPIGDELE